MHVSDFWRYTAYFYHADCIIAGKMIVTSVIQYFVFIASANVNNAE